ncbi:hypothetical protein SJA_C1-27480 [Sphingobium indicum UT26S]|uniref:Uncharacterized protein n=1 Tax=Sphingobium indicum (strain DSM 16413 / CCM 7287 / MTCC 6362 / UT26 / NBRC 101211 / UT26S) TaxID=452662 RepID=D4Z4Q0_SPHIU|nr:hypothetical protein SJA_C1-27480 [Sphingobium indicum UT26S]
MGGKRTYPIPPHRRMGRGTARSVVEGNGARPGYFPLHHSLRERSPSPRLA